MELNDTETTKISSAACVLLISARFRTVLNHLCAGAARYGGRHTRCKSKRKTLSVDNESMLSHKRSTKILACLHYLKIFMSREICMCPAGTARKRHALRLSVGGRINTVIARLLGLGAGA